MQNRCDAQRKRLKLEAGLIGEVLAARPVGRGRLAPTCRQWRSMFPPHGAVPVPPNSTAKNGRTRRAKGGPRRKTPSRMTDSWGLDAR